MEECPYIIQQLGFSVDSEILMNKKGKTSWVMFGRGSVVRERVFESWRNLPKSQGRNDSYLFLQIHFQAYSWSELSLSEGSFVWKHPCSYLEHLLSACINHTHLSESSHPDCTCLGGPFLITTAPNLVSLPIFLNSLQFRISIWHRSCNLYLATSLCICFLNIPIDYALWARSTPSILHSF